MAGGWAFVGTGSSGGTTTPGGSDTNIQFNNNGSFSGSALLTTDGSGSLSASVNISASAFYGDGSNLTNVTASAVEVADGPEYSLQFRFDTPVSGDLSGSSDLVWNTGTKELIITGNVRLEDGKEFYGDLEGAVRFPAKNDEGAAISKGQVIYIKGVSGQIPTIALAACDDANKMPAYGLAGADAAQGAAVQIVTFGSLKGLNLSTLYGKTFAVGDTAYVETGSGGTSGSLTNVRPKGASNFIQNMGEVVRNGGGGDGQIMITGPGRANATPNLDKGYLFVGDDTNCSEQDNTVFISSSANLVGINNTNPDHALSVTGDISASINISGSGLYIENALISSSANGSIDIGQGITYTFGGKDLLDVFEGDFKLRSTDYHQAISQVQTSNFNIQGFQTFVVDCTGSVVTGTLPGIAADSQIGLTYTVKDLFGSGSTNNVVIEPSGSQKIDGGTAAKIQTNYGALTIAAFSSSARGYGWGIVSTT